jgi:hypothetical protein
VFLALTPVVAAGRAVFALAVTALSMSGHAAIGHTHLDVSRFALASILLLAFSWRTSDTRVLLAASVAAQCLVHGSSPMADLAMLSLHAAGAFLAFALISRFEVLWDACVAALRPLLSPSVPLHLSSAPRLGSAHRTVWHNPFHGTARARLTLRRGPPVLA